MKLYEIMNDVYWQSICRINYWKWFVIWYMIGELLNLWFNESTSVLAGPGVDWTLGIELTSIALCLFTYPIFYYGIWNRRTLAEERGQVNGQ